MAEVGSAYVTILPSAQGFGRKLSSEINGPSTRAGSEAGRRAGQAFHSGISRPLASVAGALAGVFAVRAVSGFLSGAIAEATEAAKVGAQTAAVLKSTRGEAGLTAEKMETKAEVTMDKVADGFAITAIHLDLKAKIPGADQAKFEELANKAKVGCPVSKVLNTNITLSTTLL